MSDNKKLVDGITKALLSAGMTAYDLGEPNEGVSFEATYINKYMTVHVDKDGKVTEAKPLPSCLGGYTKEEVLEYAKSVDGYAPSAKYMAIPLRLSMEDINKRLKGFGKGWGDLDNDEKNQLLHYMGLDVMANTNNTTRYVTGSGIHRTATGRQVNGLYVMANERTDKEWLLSGNASEEAKLYTEDYELQRELSIMNR